MKLVTEKELQSILKVSRQTLFDWRQQGMPYIKFGKPVRYELDKVLEWLSKK